jgi:hypothetical protein
VGRETLPGISIAVAVDGEVVWAEGFGFADIEQCCVLGRKGALHPRRSSMRELLGNLGGIRGYNAEEGDKLDRDVYRSVSESLNRFKDDPL